MSLFHAKAKTLERAQRKFPGRGDIPDVQGMGGDYLDFAEVISDIRDQMSLSTPAVAGQLVTGRVLTVDDKGATLDFGGKMPAFLPIRELTLQSIKSALKCVSVGQEVTGEVLGFVRGVPIVSLRGLQLEEAWDRVAELAREELSFDVTVLDVNEVSRLHARIAVQMSHGVGRPGRRHCGVPRAAVLLAWFSGHRSSRCIIDRCECDR